MYSSRTSCSRSVTAMPSDDARRGLLLLLPLALVLVFVLREIVLRNGSWFITGDGIGSISSVIMF